MHDHSARPRQPWDQRCFGGPNGILMFISTADVGGGGWEGRWGGGIEDILGEEEEEQRGRLAES